MPNFGYADTAREYLERWDRGESQFTIERGGLGPGYEQAIHVLVAELIRDYLDLPLPTKDEKEAMGRWGDDTVNRIDDAALGFSGAQVGVARDLAFRYLRDGPAATITDYRRQHPDDGLIQVSNKWPYVPTPVTD